jgi:cyclase
MLKSRITPVLLIHNKGLVKTVGFKDSKYVGDPLNAVKIFNEKEVDELTVIDIDATVNGQPPNFEMIKNLASECRMPLCYGGGVRSVDDAKRIISLGAEKIAISNSAIENPKLISEISNAVGVQSVVVVLDVKKTSFFNKYEVFTHNGKKKTQKNPADLAVLFESLGAGEIIINSIDNDGKMKGYDINLIEEIRKITTIPLTALGGAGTYDDLKFLIDKFSIIGAAAGSIFVFKGKYKAVLLNYPKMEEKSRILNIN